MLVVRVAPGIFKSTTIAVQVADKNRVLISHMFANSGVVVCEDEECLSVHPISVPLFMHKLEIQPEPRVEIPAWMSGSETVLRALEAAFDQCIRLDSETLEIEKSLGTQMQTGFFKSGVTRDQFTQWQRNTTRLMVDRVSRWRVQDADDVVDWFTSVCGKCGNRNCAHPASDHLRVRQRTDRSGTSTVHKQVHQRVDIQSVTWRRVSDVVEIHGNHIVLPDWVNVSDLIFQLGGDAMVSDSGAHTIQMYHPEMTIPRLRNLNVPQPFAGVPDCRLRISTETPVNINSLLVPVTWVRKSHREDIVGESEGIPEAWRLTQYTVYEGRTEEEVNDRILPQNAHTSSSMPEYHVELELNVEYIKQKQKQYGNLATRIAAVSFLMKMYEFYAPVMKQHNVCFHGLF